MVIDIFYYNGEEDLLEIRLNVLNDVVDEFRIIEAVTTFCGKSKSVYFDINNPRFAKWKDKIKHFVNDDKYTDEEILIAHNSQKTLGDPRWMHEYLQKEYAVKVMNDLKDDDIVFLGDVDEIWQPELAKESGLLHVKLRVYTYYLNLRSDEQFWGTVRGKYKDLKGKSPNDLRINKFETDTPYQGWHFTSQGGLQAVLKKLRDQYNPDAFNAQIIQEMPERWGKEDIIGRPFTFTVDESDWPPWLQEHRLNYQYMLK